MAPELRPARPAEVARLNRLIAMSARDLSTGYYSAAQIEGLLTHLFGVDTQLVMDQTYYVIEEREELLACGGWSARRTLFGGDQAKGGSDPRLDPAADAARIRAFFVHPAAARRGLGRRLLAHCEERARAAGFRRTELMATLPGEPFYRAAGYRRLEAITHRLPDGSGIPFVRMGQDRAVGHRLA